MKKLLITILSVLLMLSAVGLFACSSTPEYTNEVNQKTWQAQIGANFTNFRYNDGIAKYDNGAYVDSYNQFYDSRIVDGEFKYYKIDAENSETEITKSQFVVPVDILDEMFTWLKNNYSAFTYENSYYVYSNTTGQAEVPELGLYFVRVSLFFHNGKLGSVNFTTLPIGADPTTAPEFANHRFDSFGSVLFDYSFEKRFNEMSNYTIAVTSPVESFTVKFTEDKMHAQYPNNPVGQQEQFWHKDTSGDSTKYVYYVKNANGTYDKDLSRTETQYNGVRKGIFDMFVTKMINAESLEIKKGKIVNTQNITDTLFVQGAGTMDVTFKNIVATLDEKLDFEKLTYNMVLSQGNASITYSIVITTGDATIELPTEFNTLNPFVESDITDGLNITAENFHYQVTVSGNTPVIVVVDGDDVSKKLGTELTAITFKNDKFYTFVQHQYLKQITDSLTNGNKITWDKTYYQETEIKTDGEAQRNEIRDLYKTYIPALTGMFSEFAFDGEKLVAPTLTIETITYTNFTISFNANKSIKEISYVLNAGEPTIQETKITFGYYTRSIDKPEYVVSYYGDEPSDMRANAPAEGFYLTADNFVAQCCDIYSGYTYLIEKDGNLIKYTFTNFSKTTITYYEKVGNNYYAYSYNNSASVWEKTTSTQVEFDEKANLLYTIACNLNSTYSACKNTTDAFNGWMCSGDISQIYSVSGTGSKAFMYVLVVNDKVDKIITRDSNKIEHEFSFNYGTAVVTLPEIA